MKPINEVADMVEERTATHMRKTQLSQLLILLTGVFFIGSYGRCDFVFLPFDETKDGEAK